MQTVTPIPVGTAHSERMIWRVSSAVSLGVLPTATTAEDAAAVAEIGSPVAHPGGLEPPWASNISRAWYSHRFTLTSPALRVRLSHPQKCFFS